jgi:hypothetical protein
MITKTIEKNKEIYRLSNVVTEFCDNSKISTKDINCSSRDLVELVGIDINHPISNFDINELKEVMSEIILIFPLFYEYVTKKILNKIYYIYSFDHIKIDYVKNNIRGTIVYESDIDTVFTKRPLLYLDQINNRQIFNASRGKGIKLLQYLAKLCLSKGYEYMFLMSTPIDPVFGYKLNDYYIKCGFTLYHDHDNPINAYAIAHIKTIISKLEQ